MFNLIEEVLINLFLLEKDKDKEKDKIKDKIKKEEDYYKVLVGNREWMERNFIEVTKSFLKYLSVQYKSKVETFV